MLDIIVWTIFIATIINVVLTKLHIPTIIGYIATGVIITYAFDLIHSQDLNTIAEFGIVFLMFTIGLEFSVQHLIKMYKEVFLYGSLQVGISILVFYILGHYYFDFGIKKSIIIASALALSSTAIVLKILNSNTDINKEYGQRVLGILIFQDIMVVPILLVISIFSSNSSSIEGLLLSTLEDAMALFLILWIFGKYILNPFLNEVVKSNSDEIFIGSILLMVLGSSTLAHNLGFSYSLGAFIAGMIISETKYKYQVEADLIPFRDIFLGIFFIAVGMQIDFDIVVDYFGIILSLAILFSIIKISIIFFMLKWSTDSRIALKTSLSLFQVGEFGLVVFELANANNLIDMKTSQILTVTVILSMIATPFVLRKISNLVDKILGSDINIESPSITGDNLTNHIIVIGYGQLGRKICNKLEKRVPQYIAVESNIQNVKEARKTNKPVIFGNASKKSILESLNISQASAVIVAMENNEKVHLVGEAISQLAPKTKIIIKVRLHKEKAFLQELFPTYEIIVGAEQIADAMVDTTLQCKL